MNEKILIIDDELGICTSLTYALEDKYDVQSVLSPIEGIDLIQKELFNICLLDLKMGYYNGLDILCKIKLINKELIVIIMTAYGSIKTSIEAIKKGAYTYLTKPLNIEELHIVIEQALEYQRLNEKVENLCRELEDKILYNGIIGQSNSMRDVFKMIGKLKNIDTNVVITGESGTGKELVARAMHFSGKRKRERFVEVNCSAIPEGLLEEELFGHKKGSFTGAFEDKKGKFEYANNGTIFLDEIGDMPYSLQAKLMRVIQQKEYTPIGCNEKVKLNLRFISATNKDLKVLIENGKFRHDLYFRLNVIEIKIKPLRNRKQDIPLLIKHFIKLNNEKLNKNIKGISREVERKLINYNYPGNVRELSNIIESAIVLSNGSVIELKCLPREVIYYDECYNEKENIFMENLAGKKLKEVERIVIEAGLLKNKGHRKSTALMLGISEKGLRNKIKEYKIII